MTSLQPPRLAVALLNRLVPENEPLAGDVLEEFRARRSRLWLWRQVLVAVACAALSRKREVRPLRLVGVDAAAHRDGRSPQRTRVVNLSATPAPSLGVGGLGLVMLGILVTQVRPAAWALLAAGAAGGILLAVAIIIARRRRQQSPLQGSTLVTRTR
jgi:hypothetical protein